MTKLTMDQAMNSQTAFQRHNKIVRGGLVVAVLDVLAAIGIETLLDFGWLPWFSQAPLRWRRAVCAIGCSAASVVAMDQRTRPKMSPTHCCRGP
jgi:hypothetical protein